MNQPNNLPKFVPLTPADGKALAPTTGLHFAANVQHPLPAIVAPDGSNDRTTDKPGDVMVSILSAQKGNALLVQIAHADGTTLGLFLSPETLGALKHCLQVAEVQMAGMENLRLAQAAGQKPS